MIDRHLSNLDQAENASARRGEAPCPMETERSGWGAETGRRVFPWPGLPRPHSYTACQLPASAARYMASITALR